MIQMISWNNLIPFPENSDAKQPHETANTLHWLLTSEVGALCGWTFRDVALLSQEISPVMAKIHSLFHEIDVGSPGTKMIAHNLENNAQYPEIPCHKTANLEHQSYWMQWAICHARAGIGMAYLGSWTVFFLIAWFNFKFVYIAEKSSDFIRIEVLWNTLNFGILKYFESRCLNVKSS